MAKPRFNLFIGFFKGDVDIPSWVHGGKVSVNGIEVRMDDPHLKSAPNTHNMNQKTLRLPPNEWSMLAKDGSGAMLNNLEIRSTPVRLLENGARSGWRRWIQC